jgi:acyl-CoA dehydrogenase
MDMDDTQLAYLVKQIWLKVGKDADTDLQRGLAELAKADLGLPGSDMIDHQTYHEWRRVAVIAEALSRAGASFGFTLSWLLQIMIKCHYLQKHGSEQQRSAYLPDLLNGSRMGAIATSEPQVGADPKRLTTRAKFNGSHFIITGDKAFITNGPLAHFFIVLAITGEANGRRLYSAFLIDRDTPGLTVTKAADMTLLLPAQHGGLTLRNVGVPAEAMLGSQGDAFDQLAKPFRLLEDALGFAIITGVMRRILDLALIDIRALASAPGNIVLERLGRANALADMLSRETRELAAALNGEQIRSLLMPRMIGLRSLVQMLTTELETLLSADPRLTSSRAAWLPVKALLNFAHRGATQEARRMGSLILTHEEN